MKDPAFLFYPGDWQGGTMHMTHLEKGCYMDLLMLQFNRGKFTEAQAKHMLQSSFDVAWATIQEKFKCENGLYWNERLYLEKEKRAKFTESRRNNAKRVTDDNASEKHMLKDMDEHTDKRMEDENINSNSIGIGGVGEKPISSPTSIKKPLSERKEDFKQTLVPYVEKYGRDMLNEFFKYWTESNKSETAFRYEGQKFWDLSKRLTTWHKNQKTEKTEFASNSAPAPTAQMQLGRGGITFTPRNHVTNENDI
jgi:hypothetical protein